MLINNDDNRCFIDTYLIVTFAIGILTPIIITAVILRLVLFIISFSHTHHTSFHPSSSIITVIDYIICMSSRIVIITIAIAIIGWEAVLDGAGRD